MSKSALGHHLLNKASKQQKVSQSDLVAQKLALLRSRLFDKQLAYLDDTSDRKAILCPRRAGKTTAIVYDIVLTSLTVKRARMLVIGITRLKARDLVWDALKILNDELNLGIEFNNHYLEAHFPSGGKLQLGGADSRHEIEKYRGGYYHKVWIDECKSYPPSILEELVKQVIEPALLDYRGTLTLAGTPGAILHGLFYEVTKEGADKSKPYDGTPIVRELGVRGPTWSFHFWTVKDNTALPELWRAALLQKESSGISDDDPIWRREGLGQWVADDAGVSFAFNPERDVYLELPKNVDFKYCLGVDLGYDDDTAFVVLAYSDVHPVCYEVYTHSEPKLAPHEVAARIHDLEERFGEFEAMVGDRGGLGKMIFQELSDKYGVSLIAADKHQKRDHVELINSDFMSERLKIRRDSSLFHDLHFIQWNKAGNNFDKLSAKTHNADAFLYIWRYVHHHFFETQPRKLEKNSEEYIQKQLDEAERRISERGAVKSVDYFANELSGVVDDVCDWMTN